MKPGGLSLRQDQIEFVKARCEPASIPRARARQEGTQCTSSEIREVRSMTGSLHWVTVGTRPDEAFATSQLQRKQSAPLVSDHKCAVQTKKRLRCQPEICLRFRPLSTKMCVLACTDSALQRADADTDDEGSDDERLAKAKHPCSFSTWCLGLCGESGRFRENRSHSNIFMTWKSKAAKRTILSTFGTVASACRVALDLAEYTRAMLCEALIGARVLPIRGSTVWP